MLNCHYPKMICHMHSSENNAAIKLVKETLKSLMVYSEFLREHLLIWSKLSDC